MAKNPTEIEKELLNMPEYVIWEEINALNNSFDVFQGNYLELKNAFESFSKKRKEKMEDRLKKLVRLLHNFTASAISLLDHSKVYYEKLYEPNGLFGDYETEYNNRFRDDDLSCFIRDLRNYCTHITAAEIQAEYQYTGSPETSCTTSKIYITKKFLFKKSTLFKRGDWSESSKRYIDSIPNTNSIAKWYFYKRELQDENLISQLLEKRVIKSYEDTHLLVYDEHNNPSPVVWAYFDENIKNEDQLKECLKQIGISETEPILSIWQRHHEKEKIVLEDHIDKYFIKTKEFYSWIKLKEKQIYSKEIDLVNKKQSELEKADQAFWSS